MTKFWMILAFYLLGVISGVILWEKVDFKTIYKGTIKMRQRGKGNTQNSNVSLKRKEDRIQKRNEKKKAKDLKRLEKNS